jgi:hypothetical protein
VVVEDDEKVKGIYLIVMQTGYVESGQLGMSVWQASALPKELAEKYPTPPYEDPVDALRSMTRMFVHRVRLGLDHIYPKSKCCREFLYGDRSHDDKRRHCPECNTEIRGKFNVNDFGDALTKVAGLTADEWGGEEWYDCWWPWVSLWELQDASPDNILYIPEQAEVILSSLIDPEFLDEEELNDLKEDPWFEMELSPDGKRVEIKVDDDGYHRARIKWDETS